jgi:hypothetical protein
MNNRLMKGSAVLAVLGLLSGCATMTGYKHGEAILSAEQAESMIHVEVRLLEPLPVEQAMADLQ